MRNRIFAFLLLMVLCASVMAPAAYATEGNSGVAEPVAERNEDGGWTISDAIIGGAIGGLLCYLVSNKKKS